MPLRVLTNCPMAVLFLVLLETSAAASINYCETIRFDIGKFDRSTLLKASRNSDCRQQKVPLIFNTGNRALTADIYLTPSTPSYAAYIGYDKESDRYFFDKAEFDKERQNSELFKKIDFDNYSYAAVVKSRTRNTGTAVACEIKFFDRAGKYTYATEDISFFKIDRFSATYSSGLIKAENKKYFEMFGAIKELFFSMEIDW